VSRSGETLQGIVGAVKRVTDIVTEIAASSSEQSSGIEQVNTAMTQMDQVTQSNSAQTEELSATAESLSEQAGHLLELVGTFTLRQSGSDQHDRQAFQAHAAQPLKSASRQPAKAIRSSGAAKSDFKARGGKRIKNQQSALGIAGPGAPAADDASFQEF
jgi:methyl-accepting chemotaxis protein